MKRFAWLLIAMLLVPLALWAQPQEAPYPPAGTSPKRGGEVGPPPSAPGPGGSYDRPGYRKGESQPPGRRPEPRETRVQQREGSPPPMGGPGRFDGAPQPLDMIVHGLNLSAEQMERLKQIQTNLEEALLPLELKHRKMKIEIAEMLAVSAAGKGNIIGKLAEISQVEREKQQLTLEHYLQARDLLTAPQKKMFTRWLVQQVIRP